MANFYVDGSKIKCSVEIRDSETEALVDPTTVVFKWITPETRKTTTWTYGIDVQLVKASTGKYYALIDLDYPGHWYYRFEWSGNYTGAAEARVYAQKSQFA